MSIKILCNEHQQRLIFYPSWNIQKLAENLPILPNLAKHLQVPDTQTLSFEKILTEKIVTCALFAPYNLA